MRAMHSIILRKSLISSGILLPKRKSKRLTKYGLAIMIRYVLNCQNVLVACYEYSPSIFLASSQTVPAS